MSTENVIMSLKRKIEILMGRYETLRVDNSKLANEVATYKQTIEINNNKIKELQQKIDNLQFAAAFKHADDGNTNEAKRKIAKLVKEIDKCIALLNE